MAADATHLAGAVVGAVMLGVVVLRRLVRMGATLGEQRTLQLDALWVAPLVYLGVVILDTVFQPPHGIEWLWLAAGVAVGAALGWWRGKTVEIQVNPDTRELTTRTSASTAIYIVALLLVRFGLGTLLVGEAGSLHLTLQLIAGLLLTFGLGLVAAQRLEMTLRAARLLAEAPLAGPPLAPGVAAAYAATEASPAPAPARSGLAAPQLAMLAAAVFAVVVAAGLVLAH